MTDMPLEKAPAGSPGFSRNVATEVKSGKPVKQAVAIAYSKAGERRDAASETLSIGGKNYTITQVDEKFWKYESGRDFIRGRKQNVIEDLRNLLKERARKDGTQAVTGMPMNAKLDAVLAAADALYARADAAETGRWDARPAGSNAYQLGYETGKDGGSSRLKEQLEDDASEQEKEDYRRGFKAGSAVAGRRKDSERDLPGEATMADKEETEAEYIQRTGSNSGYGQKYNAEAVHQSIESAYRGQKSPTGRQRSVTHGLLKGWRG